MLNKFIKYNYISRILEYLKKDNIILDVYRKKLILLVTMEFGYLQRCCTHQKPISPSKTNSFVVSRVIYID